MKDYAGGFLPGKSPEETPGVWKMKLYKLLLGDFIEDHKDEMEQLCGDYLEDARAASGVAVDQGEGNLQLEPIQIPKIRELQVS